MGIIKVGQKKLFLLVSILLVMLCSVKPVEEIANINIFEMPPLISPHNDILTCSDQFGFLGNCPNTPPLTGTVSALQSHASEKHGLGFR